MRSKSTIRITARKGNSEEAAGIYNDLKVESRAEEKENPAIRF